MESASRPTGRTTAARGIGAAAIVAAVVTGGLTVAGGALGPVLPGPTVAAPAPAPASTVPSPDARAVVIDPGTGRLTVGGWLTGRLPTAPFHYDPPTTSAGLFDELVIAAVTSDPGWRHDENAPPALMVGTVEPRSVVVGDLGATGRGMATDVAARLFKQLPELAIGGQRSDRPFTLGALPAAWSHAEVTGRLSTGVAERSTVSVLVVALPGAQHFALVQVRPERAAVRRHLAALDAAAGSLAAVGR